MAKLDSLQDLYIEALRDLYNAEGQLVKALPRLAKAASHPELQQAFHNHLAETETQMERLEQVFEMLDMKPRGKKCVAMEGLIAEGKEIMAEDAEDHVRDAALIAAAQKMEHYEIGAYGTCATWAKLLGFTDQSELLVQTLNEEKRTDELLTQIAENAVNIEAAEPDTGGFSMDGHSRNGRKH